MENCDAIQKKVQVGEKKIVLIKKWNSFQNLKIESILMENGSVMKTSFGEIREAVFKILFFRPVQKECIKRYDTPKIRPKLLQEKNCCLWFVKYLSPQLNRYFFFEIFFANFTTSLKNIEYKSMGTLGVKDQFDKKSIRKM